MQFSNLCQSDDTEPLDSSGNSTHEKKENFLTRIFNNPAMDEDLTDSEHLISN